MTTSLFVLWSGGADSTFLVEHSLADPAYDLVLAGYVHIQNNEAKAASELAAIERMLPLLRANPRFEYAGIIAQVNYPRTNPNLAYKQIPIWLHALVEAIHFPVDEVAIGYCGGDDAAQHIATIQTIYASYQPLMHRRLPPLRFPLAQYTKAEVAARLSPALRDKVVYCEYPVATPEGRYEPCQRCRICKSRAARLTSE